MKRIIHILPILSAALVTACFGRASLAVNAYSQSTQASQTSPEPQQSQTASSKSAQEKTDDSQEPFVIERSVTRAEFENDGTDRTDLEVVVNVLNEEGVQKFGQLVFGYNSVNQRLEVVSVEVRKAGSSTFTAASAVRDVAPMASGAPAYTTYREKRVTVPGLRPGDTVAYRISKITTIPSAPGQFWFEYDFVRDAIVLDEQLEISVPQNREAKLKTRPGADPEIYEESGRRIYRWKVSHAAREAKDTQKKKQPASEPQIPSVQITTFENWEEVGRWYSQLQRVRATPDTSVRAKAEELTGGRSTDLEKIEALYDFVAAKIRTVSLPFGLGSYQPREASEILAAGYGDPKDKHTLLEALLEAVGIRAIPALLSTARDLDPDLPSPGQLNHVITAVPQGADGKDWAWLDTAMEVAPFRMLAAGLRGKQALVIPMDAPGASSLEDVPRLVETAADPPSLQVQEIEITGQVSPLGKLTAHVHYSMTGDNALVLRVGFRATRETDRKRLAQLLSAGDGFRGEVTDVKSSDPFETRKPFEVDYDISQAKFVDWSRKSLQMRLPLPALGIPEVEESAESGAKSLKLGSPLQVHVRATIELPAGYAPRAPVPVSMSRDFAWYRSNYSVKGSTVVAQREIAFLQREIPATLLLDYGAFAHAAHADEAQIVSIEAATKRPEGPVHQAKRPPVAAH